MVQVHFNLNQKIKVKLTKAGLLELEKQSNYVAHLLGSYNHEFIPPTVDEEGYSTFQAWSLFHNLGHLLCLDNPELPFHPDVIILTDAQELLWLN